MAKKIMLFVLAFTLAAVVIFTGCTPARRPMNTNYQSYRTGQINRTGTGTNQGLGNNWGTYNGLGSNNGMGNGFNTNTTYDNYNGLGTNNGLGRNNATGTNVSYNTTAQTTTDLERSIAQIPGVRAARVVISGNTAYVGITSDINAVNNTNLNNTVAQQVRASDANISTVYVSNDETFMNRLTNVGNGIRGGRPISGFTNELREMVRRINPVNW